MQLVVTMVTLINQWTYGPTAYEQCPRALTVFVIPKTQEETSSSGFLNFMIFVQESKFHSNTQQQTSGPEKGFKEKVEKQ